MKRTYTISYKIPKGTASLTPQGLRNMYEEGKGSKRTREFKVEVISDKVPDTTDFNDTLEKRLIEAVRCFFSTPDMDWLKEYYYEVTRLRNLFLYDRDNLPLWTEIERILTEFLQGLASETCELELGKVLPVVECVDRSVKAKLALFYDYFYWFNPLVKNLYGTTDVLEYLEGLYARLYSHNPAITAPMDRALLSLHNQALMGSGSVVFTEWFGRCFKINEKGGFMDRFLHLVCESSMQQLATGTDFEEWLANYSVWRDTEETLWRGMVLDQSTVDSVLHQLEVLMLVKALEQHREQLALMLMKKPESITEVLHLSQKDKQVSRVFRSICSEIVPRYYSAVRELAAATPLVTAALLCDLVDRTLRDDIRSLFEESWKKFMAENTGVAAALAQLAVRGMQSQHFGNVKKIAELLQLDKVHDGELSPFLEAFSESLWKEVCGLCSKRVGKGRTNRYTHGINLLRSKAPMVGWNAKIYLELVESQPVLNQVYWPNKIRFELGAPLAPEPELGESRRIVQWDREHSYCSLQLNGRDIVASFSAYQVLEQLLKSPGYGLKIGNLTIPKGLLDMTLKELIREQWVLYIPLTKLRRFEENDMVYISYK